MLSTVLMPHAPPPRRADDVQKAAHYCCKTLLPAMASLRELSGNGGSTILDTPLTEMTARDLLWTPRFNIAAQPKR